MRFLDRNIMYFYWFSFWICLLSKVLASHNSFMKRFFPSIDLSMAISRLSILNKLVENKIRPPNQTHHSILYNPVYQVQSEEISNNQIETSINSTYPNICSMKKDQTHKKVYHGQLLTRETTSPFFTRAQSCVPVQGQCQSISRGHHRSLAR